MSKVSKLLIMLSVDRFF